MTAAVAALVLTAALFHAVWNALVKGAEDRVIMLGLIALGHVPVGLSLILLFPMPHQSAWPWLIASVIVHWAYFWLLNTAYKLETLARFTPSPAVSFRYLLRWLLNSGWTRFCPFGRG